MIQNNFLYTPTISNISNRGENSLISYENTLILNNNLNNNNSKNNSKNNSNTKIPIQITNSNTNKINSFTINNSNSNENLNSFPEYKKNLIYNWLISLNIINTNLTNETGENKEFKFQKK